MRHVVPMLKMPLHVVPALHRLVTVFARPPRAKVNLLVLRQVGRVGKGLGAVRAHMRLQPRMCGLVCLELRAGGEALVAGREAACVGFFARMCAAVLYHCVAGFCADRADFTFEGAVVCVCLNVSLEFGAAGEVLPFCGGWGAAAGSFLVVARGWVAFAGVGVFAHVVAVAAGPVAEETFVALATFLV